MTELSKNKIKLIKSLEHKKNRNELNLFVVEGEKMVQEIIELSPKKIKLIISTEDFIGDIALSSEKIKVSDNDLRKVSFLKTPNKALAVVEKFDPQSEDGSIIIALDGIQDPGNFGTILRTADWFGIKKIVCSIDTVDLYNPKVVQASMGAIYRVKVEYLDLNHYLKNADSHIYGTLLEGNSIYKEQLESKAILLMGNEGKGIRKELLPLISNPVSIPRFGSGESLNVGVATGIFLSEFCRSIK